MHAQRLPTISNLGCMARLVTWPLWNFTQHNSARSDFFAVFGQRFISLLHSFIDRLVFKHNFCCFLPILF